MGICKFRIPNFKTWPYIALAKNPRWHGLKWLLRWLSLGVWRVLVLKSVLRIGFRWTEVLFPRYQDLQDFTSQPKNYQCWLAFRSLQADPRWSRCFTWPASPLFKPKHVTSPPIVLRPIASLAQTSPTNQKPGFGARTRGWQVRCRHCSSSAHTAPQAALNIF